MTARVGTPTTRELVQESLQHDIYQPIVGRMHRHASEFDFERVEQAECTMFCDIHIANRKSKVRGNRKAQTSPSRVPCLKLQKRKRKTKQFVVR